MRNSTPGLERILRSSGSELAILRRSEGLSQFELAEITGLHKNTIANVERGTGDASILAVSLMQVHLRATGVLIEADGFMVCPPLAGTHDYPFPQLIVPPSMMIRGMGLGSCLRRLELGLSLRELAAICRLHPNTIWNFERGLVAPSTSTTFRIFRGLEIRKVCGSGKGLDFS
jgi:transcriptional regulator with XRE-family HTH domain